MSRKNHLPFAGSGSEVAVALTPAIRALLAALVSEVIDLFGPAPDDPLAAALDTSPVDRPDDPALRRLLPDGYADEVDGGRAASEFRRLTDGDLRAGKRADAQLVLATLGAASLSIEDAEAWARALNDVRLALGARLGLENDEDVERLVDAAEATGAPDPLLEEYEVLGLLQAGLIEALDEVAPF